MLRYRYFVHVEQIKENIRSGKADEALAIADSLEPARIRSNSDLHIIADLYIEKGNYARAQVCLTELYNRKKTRGILMQLINLSIRIRNVKDAENYFHEFRAMNPNDYYNYIFRYNLDKVEGKPNEVLIKSLENLKNAEYIEPWAYQLAKLYHKEGRKEACVRECEEIIAWFGYGDYVDRAKALLAYYKGELEIKPEDTLEDAVKKSELEEEFTSEIEGKADYAANDEADIDYALNDADSFSDAAEEIADDAGIDSADSEMAVAADENDSDVVLENSNIDFDSSEDSLAAAVSGMLEDEIPETAVEDEVPEAADSAAVDDEAFETADSAAVEAEVPEIVDSAAVEDEVFEIADNEAVAEETPAVIVEDEILVAEQITESEYTESISDEIESVSKEYLTAEPESISEQEDAIEPESEPVPEQGSEDEREEDYSDEEINEGVAAYGANTVERIEKDITDSLKEDYSDRYSATLEDEIELSLAAAVIAEIGEEAEPEPLRNAEGNRLVQKESAENAAAKAESEAAAEEAEPEASKPAEYVGHEFKALKAATVAEGSVLDGYLKKYSTSLEEIFGFYAYQKEVRAQLIKALEIQLNPQVRNKCLVISGGRNSGIKKLIRCTAKMLHQAGFLKDYHVANTEAEKVNSIRLSDKLDRLMGYCMVINNAGSLTSEAATQLPEMKEIMSGKVVVVLTDYRSELNRLFRDNRELNSVFPLRIHIPEFDKDDLEDLVFFKANESDCKIEKTAFEEIQKELRRMIREGNEGILSEADTFITAVIDSVETRNAKILMSGGIAAAAEAEKTITLADVKAAKVEEQ